ncbi:MAG: hypothetical protein M1282_01540 [Chloroflexi bacterium]|nr:hypothetical protein [Chloroflexota bacterium]
MKSILPLKPAKAVLYFVFAYWIITILGVLLTMAFAIIFHPPSPEELGVTASKAPAYLMTLPYHPLLNLVWLPFAWLYLRGFAIEIRKSEALRLGIFWAFICVVLDLISWVLIPHPWAMTFKEFYVDYQPWITMIYLIIFASPILITGFSRRELTGMRI